MYHCATSPAQQYPIGFTSTKAGCQAILHNITRGSSRDSNRYQQECIQDRMQLISDIGNGQCYIQSSIHLNLPAGRITQAVGHCSTKIEWSIVFNMTSDWWLCHARSRNDKVTSRDLKSMCTASNPMGQKTFVRLCKRQVPYLFHAYHFSQKLHTRVWRVLQAGKSRR